MGIRRDYFRHSRRVTASKRWKALRYEVLRRDQFRCVKCGSRRKLEVDHIVSVKQDASLSYEIENLQVLCKVCHASKTRAEIHGPLSPERAAWKDLVMRM